MRIFMHNLAFGIKGRGHYKKKRSDQSFYAHYFWLKRFTGKEVNRIVFNLVKNFISDKFYLLLKREFF